jgi:hypothetical protein
MGHPGETNRDPSHVTLVDQSSYELPGTTWHSAQAMPGYEMGVIRDIQSEGDEFIMDKVLSSNRFSDQEKADINRARLFYKALTVSDIANAEGMKVDEEVYFTLDSPPPNISKWKWPNQPTITSKQRNLWERMIRTLFV